MQRLEVSGAVRPIYGSLGVRGLKCPTAVTSMCVRTLEILRCETPVNQPHCKLQPTPKASTLLITFQSKGTNYRQTQLAYILYALFW